MRIMTGRVTLYFSDISGNKQIKKRQMHIRSMLEAQKIPFEVVDVAQDQEALEKMRRLVDDEEALPPQIMNGDVYCGTFEEFEASIEEGTLQEFLRLK
ncbi:SH3 domain-binding glutamic acid-rich-like protein 3 [Montipora foliosa]|uniref:SH3 domain-binding glutamic acid-rich-like protein 3 n=1 Tax=Montipora foliosa TaxID=591990 RepID=UPI0035F1A279